MKSIARVICHQWFNLNFSEFYLLVTIAPFWRLCTECKQWYALLHPPHCKDALFHIQINASIHVEYTSSLRWGGCRRAYAACNSSGYELNPFFRVSLHLESRSHESARETVYLPQLVLLSTCFLVSSKRLYDIHVTWVDRLLLRKGDSTALQ